MQNKTKAEIVKTDGDVIIKETTEISDAEIDEEIIKTGGFVTPKQHQPWHKKYIRAFSILTPWSRKSKCVLFLTINFYF